MDSKQPDTLLRVLQSKEETRAFYDKISRVYDLLAERSEGPVRKAGLEKLGATVGQRVLEIGYGTGNCLTQLADAVWPKGKVFGIDLSEGMRARARERLPCCVVITNMLHEGARFPRGAPMSNSTGDTNEAAGIYESACHPKERTVLDGQQFPRWGSCNRNTNWILVRSLDKNAKLKTGFRENNSH